MLLQHPPREKIGQIQYDFNQTLDYFVNVLETELDFNFYLTHIFSLNFSLVLSFQPQKINLFWQYPFKNATIGSQILDM